MITITHLIFVLALWIVCELLIPILSFCGIHITLNDKLTKICSNAKIPFTLLVLILMLITINQVTFTLLCLSIVINGIGSVYDLKRL